MKMLKNTVVTQSLPGHSVQRFVRGLRIETEPLRGDPGREVAQDSQNGVDQISGNGGHSVLLHWVHLQP